MNRFLLNQEVLNVLLDLSGNSVGDDGSQAKPLQQLNLKRNFAGANGALALADSLKGNTALQQLNLGYNFVGDDGARVLGEVLQWNAALQKLELAYNADGAERAQARGEAPPVTTATRPSRSITKY